MNGHDDSFPMIDGEGDTAVLLPQAQPGEPFAAPLLEPADVIEPAPVLDAAPIRELRQGEDALASRLVTEPPRQHARPGTLQDIPVDVHAVLGRTKISISELMAAQQGHCFLLDRKFGEAVELQINGQVIGYGEIVSDDYHNLIGIKLISVGPTE